MAKKLFVPDLERHPLNEIEAALEPLETSWVDFLYGLRGFGRYIRAGRRSGMRGFGLAKVHLILDHRRQQLDDGNRTAIFSALVYCAEENVPLPYWLADEILEIAKKVHREPSSLHELFGLGTRLPVHGKRATKARQDVQLQGRLWSTTSELMFGSKMSKESAIKLAREQLKFPYSQRKSREMFDSQDKIQAEYLSAGKGRKAHCIK